MQHRLRVDWIRCEGYGLCGDLMPEVIELDEWRYPILSREPLRPGQLGDAQRAIDCCPRQALILDRVATPDKGPGRVSPLRARLARDRSR